MESAAKRTSECTRLLGTLALVASFAVGCGDDDSDIDKDTDSSVPDGQVTADAGVDAGDDPDAGEDQEAKVVPLSATGSDQFFGVTFDDEGNFYAVGFTGDGTEATTDRSFAVAKFLPSGELDTSFGGDGIVTYDVAEGGRNVETARAVVVQSTGKIVVGGHADHDVDADGLAANDRDIALVRFNDDGSLDEEFGEDGVEIIDLNEGVETEGMNGPTWSAADQLWTLLVDDEDRLIIHGNQRAEGEERTDTDWVLLRLTPDGEADGDFSGDGKFTLDIEEVSGNARGVLLLADGSIIASGYANTPSYDSTQPVLYKVTSEGELDDEFGIGGVFHQVVLTTAAEAYTAVLQGTSFVTVGYGRETSTASLDWVSLRVTADGELDDTYGNAGVTQIDVAGHNDNGRTMVALPDGRLALAGGGRPTEDNIDGMVAVLTADGDRDPSFGTLGVRLFDFGGPADMLWGSAVSPDETSVVFVGIKGAGSEGIGPTNNDDAAIVILPVSE